MILAKTFLILLYRGFLLESSVADPDPDQEDQGIFEQPDPDKTFFVNKLYMAIFYTYINNMIFEKNLVSTLKGIKKKLKS